MGMVCAAQLAQALLYPHPLFLIRFDGGWVGGAGYHRDLRPSTQFVFRNRGEMKKSFSLALVYSTLDLYSSERMTGGCGAVAHWPDARDVSAGWG